MFQRQDSCGQMNRTIMQFKNSNFPVIWKKVKWREDKLKLRPSLNQGLFFGEYDHIKFPSGIPKKKVNKILPSRQRLTLGSFGELWPLCSFLLNFLFSFWNILQSPDRSFSIFWLCCREGIPSYFFLLFSHILRFLEVFFGFQWFPTNYSSTGTAFFIKLISFCPKISIK